MRTVDIMTYLTKLSHRLGKICYSKTNQKLCGNNYDRAWIKLYIEYSSSFDVTIPQPLMIEITLALLEDE